MFERNLISPCVGYHFKENEMFYKMIPHLMGFVVICITTGGHEHEFSQILPKFPKNICDLEVFRKLPIPMVNIM